MAHQGFHSVGVQNPYEVTLGLIFLVGIQMPVVIQERCIDLILDSLWTREIPDLILELPWLIHVQGPHIPVMTHESPSTPESLAEEAPLALCLVAAVTTQVSHPSHLHEDPSHKVFLTSVMLIFTTPRGILR